MNWDRVEGNWKQFTMPVVVAADLVPVLASLAEGVDGTSATRFTKMPRQWAVGTARHERLVLIKFDDDPPYGLAPDVAETLWREVRDGTEAVSQQKAPALQ
jgi:hypothetical protein